MYRSSATQYAVSRTGCSNPAASHIHVARRHDLSCDSSGCPNALSCARASVATNSLRRSGVLKMGSSPDSTNARRRHHDCGGYRATSRGRWPGRTRQTLHRRYDDMTERTNSTNAPIKVGVIADQTGPLSFVGLANANVARMVIGDINAKGGLLGREVKLCLEDSETSDAAAAASAARLVDQDVDVILGGIYSSTRQAIKGAAVVQGRKLYIYPEQYEGEESDPLIFCTGPVPAQQVNPFIPWLMQQTGAKKFYLPSADYIWPRTMNRKVREVVTANGGTIVGEEYFPVDHTDYRRTVARIVSSGAEVVFNTTVPPGLGAFLEQL